MTDDGQDLSGDHAGLEHAADHAGDADLRARHQRMGLRGPRQRIEALLDAGSFVEFERYVTAQFGAPTQAIGDGVVAGLGTVAGAPVAVYAQDPTVDRGSVGRRGAEKIARLVDEARSRRIPVVMLADSQGARIKEGIGAVVGNPVWTQAVARAARDTVQVTLVCGLCGGAAAYAAVLGDVVIMAQERSYMFLTGPTVTEQARGQQVGLEELGGQAMHAAHTGAVQWVVADEDEGLAAVRTLLCYRRSAEERAPAGTLGARIPSSPRQAFDIGPVLDGLFDQDSILRFEEGYGRAVVVGFARLAGRAVGFFANQSQHGAGALDVDASHKLSRHIRRTDKFGLPLLSLVDVPGFLPGLDQEQNGILLAGADLVRAFSEATVPHLSVILRRSVGGGTVLSYSAVYRLALPSASMTPMGSAAADRVKGDSQALPDGYTPLQQAAHHGTVDQIITEAELRDALCRALSAVGGPHSATGSAAR